MKERKISDVHPLYRGFAFRWRRVRDFFDGRDALLGHDLDLWYKNRSEPSSHEAPTTLISRGAYVPPLSLEQSYSDYYAYLNRGEYDNWVELSINGFRGLIIGKGVGLESIPEYMLEDCDLEGTPLEEKIEDTLTETLAIGRAGWLVDRPDVAPGTSQAEAERQAARPFIVAYKAEDIIYWRHERIGNVWKLAELVLREVVEDEDGKPDYRYRQLLIENGAYVSFVWSRKKVGDEYARDSGTIPLMNNEPLSEIPFYFFDAHGGKADPQKPPVESLVLLALAHWQSSVDLRHGAFSVSLPTLGLYGFPEDYIPTMGGLNFVSNTNAEAHGEYIELTGQGLDPLRNIIKDIEERIAKFGGRMLADEKKDAEAAETVRLRASGEVATLADIARSMARIAGQALSFANQWAGLSTEASVTLQTDYSAVSIDSAMLAALDGALTANHITQTDYNAYIRKMGLIEADRTDEDIEAELEAASRKSQDEAAASLAATAATLAAQKWKTAEGEGAAV